MKKFFILAAISFFASCSNKPDSLPLVYSFTPNIYPYSDTVYANHLNLIPFFSLGQQKTNKIIFYLNGDCSACFAKIINWQKFVTGNIETFNAKNIITAVVIHTENLEMLEYNLEKIDNSLPIYIDTLQSFSLYNSIPTYEPSIVLLDSNNIVLYSTLNHSNSKHYKQILKIIKKY